MSLSPGEALPGQGSPGPGRMVTAIVVAFVIAALIGLSLRSGTSEPKADDRAGAFGAAMSEAGCGDIQEFEDEGADHVENGTEVDYETAIPTSGTHWQAPAEAGFYEEATPAAQLVHNLEHGQVVVYYQDVAGAELVELEDYVVGDAALVAAPAPESAESAITFVAWTKLQGCERLSSEALDAFRQQFQGRGPEPITPPFEG